MLEYVTGRLVEQLAGEVMQGWLSLLVQLPLSQAQARDSICQIQERLLTRLQHTKSGYLDVEQRLRSLLEEVCTWAVDMQGYAPANLVALLRPLIGDLRGLDLSHLVLRGVHLQGVEMQDASLSDVL